MNDPANGPTTTAVPTNGDAASTTQEAEVERLRRVEFALRKQLEEAVKERLAAERELREGRA